METTSSTEAAPVVTFRPLREAGITAGTTSRDQRVVAALRDAGFELGRDAAPERYSLATADPAEQLRAMVDATRALHDLDVTVAVRRGIDFSPHAARTTPLLLSPARSATTSTTPSQSPQRPAPTSGLR
ncbi:hypothetical protein [Kitasatospora sp. NPDC017646]|uniref:hypothetical protein n=1 Tax=Kitasatospora sp. NPDC017646 TaxID=3364024 RepID=UPI0037A74D9A